MNKIDFKNLSLKEQEAVYENAFIQQEQATNQKVAAAIACLQAKTMPTPPEIISFITWNLGERTKILRHHAFWDEMKIREGFEALVETAHLAYVDICRHSAALVGISKNSESFYDRVSSAVSDPVQKDMMAFCSAAHGCIDTVRRLKSCRPDIAPNMDTAITAHFSGDVFEFIKCLRKNLSHGFVVIPNWTLTKGREGDSGSMVFNADEILAFGEWSAGAKSYINSAKDGRLNIGPAIDVYHQALIKFRQTVSDIFARNVTEFERDYYNIEDSYKRVTNAQWQKVLVSQVGKSKNPYDFLHRFFTPEQVREIRRRPDHSKEQVEFIISLRQVETACDDELRKKLYELFGVKEEEQKAA